MRADKAFSKTPIYKISQVWKVPSKLNHSKWVIYWRTVYNISSRPHPLPISEMSSCKLCSTNSFPFSNYIKLLERMTMVLSFYYPILKISRHSEQRLHSLFWNQHFITSTGHISGLQSSVFLVLPPIPSSNSPPVFWVPFVPNSQGTFHPQKFRVLALGNSCSIVGSIQWKCHVINVRAKRWTDC